jgi:hypothetical protein
LIAGGRSAAVFVVAIKQASFGFITRSSWRSWWCSPRTVSRGMRVQAGIGP